MYLCPKILRRGVFFRWRFCHYHYCHRHCRHHNLKQFTTANNKLTRLLFHDQRDTFLACYTICWIKFDCSFHLRCDDASSDSWCRAFKTACWSWFSKVKMSERILFINNKLQFLWQRICWFYGFAIKKQAEFLISFILI
jgi:hypothetical protein